MWQKGAHATKIKCFKPKTECHLCGADHLTAFCINAKGNHRRAELTVSSLETIVKERDEALKFVTPPSDKTGGPSITPSTDPGELKLAYAAAAAAAASETDPNKAAAAYTGPNFVTARSYGLMRPLAFLAYLPWLAQATHAENCHQEELSGSD